jgi:hypothetical protein
VEKVLGQIRSNCFGLDTPMLEGEFNELGEADVNFLGRAVYVEGSFFNHSCDANVARVRDGRRLLFVAKRDVQPGEELVSLMH